MLILVNQLLLPQLHEIPGHDRSQFVALACFMVMGQSFLEAVGSPFVSSHSCAYLLFSRLVLLTVVSLCSHGPQIFLQGLMAMLTLFFRDRVYADRTNPVGRWVILALA